MQLRLLGELVISGTISLKEDGYRLAITKLLPTITTASVILTVIILGVSIEECQRGLFMSSFDRNWWIFCIGLTFADYIVVIFIRAIS